MEPTDTHAVHDATATTDSNGIPLVRLTRTVQTGIGLGIGFLIVQVVALLIFGLLGGAWLSARLNDVTGGAINNTVDEDVGELGFDGGDAQACAVVMNGGISLESAQEGYMLADAGSDVESAMNEFVNSESAAARAAIEDACSPYGE